MKPHKTSQTFAEKCYKDSTGKVVLGQKPNAPIFVWGVSRLLLFVAGKETSLYKLLDAISYGALFTWAFLELFYGVNYLRRLLGALVLFVIVFNKAHL